MSFHYRKQPSARVLHLSLSFAVLVHTAPCCPTMSSLQRRFGLPTDLTPFICHSVLLIVHLLSFVRAMCPAHFHFVLVTYWTMLATLVLCLMVVLRLASLAAVFGTCKYHILTSKRDVSLSETAKDGTPLCGTLALPDISYYLSQGRYLIHCLTYLITCHRGGISFTA